MRNNLIARRRGRRWIVRDKLARLRPGAGCRRLSARAVSCRAARVRRIVLYGGAGNDRLTVIGRIPVTFRGGPGRDVTRRGSARRGALHQELAVALQLFAVHGDRAAPAQVAHHVPVHG